MDPLNYREDITREGLEFIQIVCEACAGREELDRVLEEYDVLKFAGGSGGRIVCEFPDEFLEDSAIYFDEYTYDTFTVLKASHRPNAQNYREVHIWTQANEDGSADLFAPIHAWDGAFRWVLMKRVTPVSPVEGDTAYNPITGSGQEYYYDPELPDWIENQLNKEGWDVVDADENTAFYEEQEYPCLMDYGGVSPIDGEISIPKWVTA